MSRALLRSTSVVGGMTLVSRISGFVRDVVFARFLGAEPIMDVFLVAFKIPNFLRRLFAEGAFSQAFVPVLSEYSIRQEHRDIRELADSVWGTLGVALFVVSAVGVLAAPVLIAVFAPGFLMEADGRYELAVQMLRLTFPYLLFISLTALAGSVLNTFGRFAVPAVTPVLLNLVLIGAVAGFAPSAENPGLVLALAVFVAGAVQLVFQLPFLARVRMFPRPKWGWPHEGVRRIGRLMLPAIFGSSVAQINLLFDTLIASFLTAGSISWLYYSDRLMEFPLGVFGIALATVILPQLSRQHTEASTDGFSDTLDWALRLVCVIVIPATVGLFVLSGPMLSTLFQHGKFAAGDVIMARFSLMAYAFGLLGFTLVKVLAPGFFARQDTKTPVRTGVIALVTNMILNVVFVVPMVMLGVAAPHAGLALATAIGAFVNAGLLFRQLRRDGVYRPGKGWRTLLLRIVFANVVMAAVLLSQLGALETWTSATWEQRALKLALLILAGLASYAGALWILGVRFRHLRTKPAGPAV